MPKDTADYKSPPHKIIEFLKKGRDQLRVKYRELRVKLRVAENQVRAVTKSREAWRARAEAAESELEDLKKSSGGIERRQHAEARLRAIDLSPADEYHPRPRADARRKEATSG